MKAWVAVNHSFGPPEVLELKERVCTPLGSRDFLIKGQFATVSTGDVRLRSKNIPRGFGLIMGLMFGFRRPRYESLGTDYAGQVVQIGESVQGVNLGDRVVADLGMNLNGHRTYRAMKPKDVWVKIPDNVPSDVAVAAVFGGLTASLYLNKKLKVKSKDRVLIIGAGGAVGSSAVQLAKLSGADVTAVCSASKAKIVAALGASSVLEYEIQNWKQSARDFDLVLDCVGVLDLSSARKILKPSGRVAFVVADLPLNLKCVFFSMIESRAYIAGAIQGTRDDLSFLMKLISEGKFKPLIGKRFPFTDIVGAHREVQTGHKLGATLIEF
jgi:NADPH:quinone reductase-like Zn-dependent oxidoreductase